MSAAPSYYRTVKGLGPCGRPATRFFVSLVPRSSGAVPRNRAACSACSACAVRPVIRVAVERGAIEEVPFEEWAVAEVMES